MKFICIRVNRACVLTFFFVLYALLHGKRPGREKLGQGEKGGNKLSGCTNIPQNFDDVQIEKI